MTATELATALEARGHRLTQTHLAGTRDGCFVEATVRCQVCLRAWSYVAVAAGAPVTNATGRHLPYCPGRYYGSGPVPLPTVLPS